MSTMKFILLAGVLWPALAVAQHTDYRVVQETDSSFGNVRSRITLEIEAPTANTERDKLEAMMQAAVDRHRKDWPDAVSARLWKSYRKDPTVYAQNRIVYAPDGCGWPGDKCNQPIWTELLRGEIPEDLLVWGTPKEGEQSKELACRNDLHCWGNKHAEFAIFACQPIIESLAKYDYEWTDGWFGTKLKSFRWKDRKEGSLSYKGDEVKFQNGFGAWQRVIYWCHFNPANGYAEVMVNL